MVAMHYASGNSVTRMMLSGFASMSVKLLLSVQPNEVR